MIPPFSLCLNIDEKEPTINKGSYQLNELNDANKSIFRMNKSEKTKDLDSIVDHLTYVINLNVFNGNIPINDAH